MGSTAPTGSCLRRMTPWLPLLPVAAEVGRAISIYRPARVPATHRLNYYRVEKMRFGKPSAAQKAAGERADRTTIVYNQRVTLRAIPGDAYRYQVGARSAFEWIIDRYQVKVDKSSGIRNDPNDWSREVGHPRYIMELLARVVTVSLRTMDIVDGLPGLDVRSV